MQKIEPKVKSTSAQSNGRLPLPEIQVYSVPEVNGDDVQWNAGWLVLVFRRRLPLMAAIAALTTLVAGGIIWLRDSTSQPQYTGSFELLVEPITAEAQVARQTASSEAGVLGAEGVQQSRLDYETQIRILRNPQLLQPILDQLQAQYPTTSPDVIEQILDQSLVVERIPSQDRDAEGTRIIRVSYQGTSPDTVLSVLEQLSDIYLQYALEARQTNIDQAVQFIDQQIPALQEQVDSLQARLQAFRETNTLIDPTLEGSQLTQQSGQLQQQRLDSETSIAEARSRYTALLDNDPVAILSEAPEYGTLLGLLQELEGQVAVEAARMTDRNPEMQLLQERRDNLLQLVNQEAQRVLTKVEDQIQVLEDRNRSIAQSEREIQQQIRNLPAAANTYDELQRQLTIATSILTEFSTRQKALQVDAAQQQTPWELINPPTLERDGLGEPRNIAAMNKTQYLVLAALLGSLLGIGVGLLVEMLSDRYYTTTELRQTAKLPILGEIPRQPSLLKSNNIEPGRRLLDGKSPLFLEAFQSLFTKLSLLNPTKPLRALAVTSAIPGEGKSTIALHLAHTAAAMGKRVLLVDTDLRRPQIQERLGLGGLGLSDLLTRRSVTYKQVLQKHSPDLPLYILTAGTPTDNPIRLLSSKRMGAIANEFSKSFDLVIYDTPPTLNLADTSIIGTFTDGILMVAKLGHAKREMLLGAIESLTLSNLTLVGLVANQTQLSAGEAYGYQDYGRLG